MKYSTSFFSFIIILLISCKEKPSEKLAMHTVNSTAFSFEVETIVGDMDIPWSMVFLPDNTLLITELKGTLIHFKDGIKTSIKNVPKVFARGQGGLLDIELDPNYDKNGWLYLSYASNIENDGNGGNTTIMRAKLKDNALVDTQVLYKATPNTQSGTHFGSRIEFDKDGYLYFSVGDRYKRDINPQDITKDAGKIYRINSDGSIPTDNPFYNTKGAKQAIYSYGHRNPQGMAMHPITGNLDA